MLPELKGKFQGMSLRVPVPDVSLVDLTATLSKGGDRGRRQRRDARGGERQARGHPRGQRGATRVDGLPARPALVDLRCAVHDGDRRSHREGARLVRQRVGLLVPRRRPGQSDHRRGSRRRFGGSAVEGDHRRHRRARQARPAARGPQRADARRRHHRRSPDPRGDSDHRGAPVQERASDRGRAPGPSQGQDRRQRPPRAGRRAPEQPARRRRAARLGCRRRQRAEHGRLAARRRRRDARERPLRTGRGGERSGVREAARRVRRRLRQRRLRHRPPRPRLDRGGRAPAARRSPAS